MSLAQVPGGLRSPADPRAPWRGLHTSVSDSVVPRVVPPPAPTPASAQTQFPNCHGSHMHLLTSVDVMR